MGEEEGRLMVGGLVGAAALIGADRARARVSQQQLSADLVRLQAQALDREFVRVVYQHQH
jgi:hypothetical protein